MSVKNEQFRRLTSTSYLLSGWSDVETTRRLELSVADSPIARIVQTLQAKPLGATASMSIPFTVAGAVPRSIPVVQNPIPPQAGQRTQRLTAPDSGLGDFLVAGTVPP